MTLWKWRFVRFSSAAVVILFLLAIFCSLQMQDVRWDEEIIYTGDGPFWKFEDVEYGGKQVDDDGTDEHDANHVDATTINIPHPIILWWTPFTGERGRVKKCGDDRCFFTVDRHYQEHPNTSAFLFYGTDFKPEDVPVPRRSHHEWALFHEESPKNNYILAHEECLTLFNHTATFKRDSDYPLTTQYLKNMEELASMKYVKTLDEKKAAGLAPIVYVQSDCDPPSDRDAYVRELMRYVPVDSYGACVHNRELPQKLKNPLTMEEGDFYEIVSRYKFTLAFENALCDDYITEKLWRPLVLGSVPVYRGSSTIRDWLPDENAAIVADDFNSPKELAEYLRHLDADDEAYKKHLMFKEVGATSPRLVERMKTREWGVNDYTKINFIDGFECLVCNRLHENLRRKMNHQSAVLHNAKASHYSCPRPHAFNAKSEWAVKLYKSLYDEDKHRANVLRQLIDSGVKFTAEDFTKRVNRLAGRF